MRVDEKDTGAVVLRIRSDDGQETHRNGVPKQRVRLIDGCQSDADAYSKVWFLVFPEFAFEELVLHIFQCGIRAVWLRPDRRRTIRSYAHNQKLSRDNFHLAQRDRKYAISETISDKCEK